MDISKADKYCPIPKMLPPPVFPAFSSQLLNVVLCRMNFSFPSFPLLIKRPFNLNKLPVYFKSSHKDNPCRNWCLDPSCCLSHSLLLLIPLPQLIGNCLFVKQSLLPSHQPASLLLALPAFSFIFFTSFISHLSSQWVLKAPYIIFLSSILSSQQRSMRD